MNALAPVTYETEKGGSITLSAEDIRAYLVKGQGNVTDSEILIFMNQCKTNQLDPFANDAWLIKYGDSPATIILSKDAFIKRADNHPQYDGTDSGIAVVNNNKLVYRKGSMLLDGEILVGGWCDVYRKDRSHPTHSEVAFKEYNTGKSNWLKMPATMICKVAKAQAHREAFPNQFAGLYDESEIPTGDVEKTSNNIIDADVIVDDVPEPEPHPTDTQKLLGSKMRECADLGVTKKGIRERIESELGREITELNDHECEKAIAIVQSIIADKQEIDAQPALYDDDINF